MQIKEPNYYAVITADVRYHKELTANAKLLYAEITALCQKEGFCWATNKYFADLYGLSKDRVSHLIGDLVKYGFIKVEVVDQVYRKIYLTLAKNSYPHAKNTVKGSQKQQGGVAKNSDIIIQDNNKKNKGLKLKGYKTAADMPDLSGDYYEKRK